MDTFELVKYYTGDIVPQENVVFVFGSNPEGRHGLGAAKVAREQFGARWGIGEGLVGNSYGIPTKDLRIKDNSAGDFPSNVHISEEWYNAFVKGKCIN